MKKNNRKCIVCGKLYTYCPHCGADATKPAWYAEFHDENCREIFHIVSEYLANEITKEEAQKRVQKCDLSHKKTFKASISRELDTIIASENREFHPVYTDVKKKFKNRDVE